MTNKGFPQTFLGLNIIRDHSDGSITINQAGKIDKLLSDLKMTNSRAVKTPLDPSLPLTKRRPEEKACEDVTLYQSILGKLSHMALYSRPDISFAVSKLSQFSHDPSMAHFHALKHVVRYLKGTRNYSLKYYGGSSEHIGVSDADWAQDRDDRKSYTGYAFIVNGAPVSWNSHKQSTVALSTLQAEYMALSDASRECIARSHFYEELELPIPTPVIHSDNQGALVTAQDPTNYSRTKHIDLRYHFIRDCIEDGTLAIDYVPGEDNPADIFTKALPHTKHACCLDLLGIEMDYIEVSNNGADFK